MSEINFKKLEKDINLFKSNVEDYFEEYDGTEDLEQKLLRNGYNLLYQAKDLINEQRVKNIIRPKNYSNENDYIKELEKLVDFLKEDNTEKKTEYINLIVKMKNKLNSLSTSNHKLHAEIINAVFSEYCKWIHPRDDAKATFIDAVECLNFVSELTCLINRELDKTGAEW